MRKLFSSSLVLFLIIISDNCRWICS